MRRLIPLLLLITTCTHKQPDNKIVTQIVKCATAEAVDYTERDFAALSTADDAVNLAFKIAGRVADVPVAKGQSVRRGELLAELDKRDVELQVEAAEATYREAESRLKRGERLLEHNAISLQEVESLKSRVAQARSAYENALDLLKETRIVAPFAGVVERVYVDTYQRVASGETIVRIVNPVSTTIGFTAPENLITELDNPATHYSVIFDAWPEVSFEAKIKSFARTSSDALGFPVSLRLINTDTSRYKISPGMTCMARVITQTSDSTTVAVPLTAIYAPIGGKDYVWVIDTESRVQCREVELGGVLTRGLVEVRKGLHAGEIVATAGVYKLTDNQQVRIIE
ncbi:MAG: efflux RND transporter periplasmic adaptor subunit [Alistipes sp.]|nr:efflux RND transporter periplasmic adaptor subunit [Alistipes sp.]